MGESVAVIDTNVIVSGFLSAHGPPGRIVEWLRQGVVRAAVDDRIIAEYWEVLRRPRFRFPVAEIDIALDRILSFAVWPDIPPDCLPGLFPDPDDRPFAECATMAKCPLVTGNLPHFPEDIFRLCVLTPAKFIEHVTSHS